MAKLTIQPDDLPTLSAPVFKKVVARAVAIPLLLVSVLAALLVWQVVHLVNVSSWVEHSDSVIARATLVQKLMIDKETGLRGYALTANTSFLEPFNQANKLLEPNLAALQDLVRDNEAQIVRLNGVADNVTQWNAYADDLKAVVQSGGAANSLVATERGKLLMDSIRSQFTSFIDSETTLRDTRTHAAKEAAVVVLGTVGGASILVGLILAAVIRRQLSTVTTDYRLAMEAQARQSQEKSVLLANERAARSDAERSSQLKDEFLATLSHELRTPLNAILGWSQILRTSVTDDESREGLDTIVRNARMQAQLIEDLLDMSRIISGKLRLDVQRVNPSTFVLAAVETMKPAADAKEIRLENVLDPNAGPVSGDPDRLQQVIWNLLSNAIKFTPKGGKVQVLLQRVNSHVEISVADTGQGISENFLPYIFERFRQEDATTTRRYGGLGLGLSIVQHLAELHGGAVYVQSAGPGQGSTFTLHLPLSIVHPHSDAETRHHPRTFRAEPPPGAGPDLDGIRVLVIDDELDARELVKRVLRTSRATVTTAGSAREALPLVESERPDVVVCDIGMPEVDGYEFIRQVRKLTPEQGGKTPAVALTAFARSEDKTRALMSGFQMHVSKPVPPSELIATIASLAGRAESASERDDLICMPHYARRVQAACGLAIGRGSAFALNC